MGPSELMLEQIRELRKSLDNARSEAVKHMLAASEAKKRFHRLKKAGDALFSRLDHYMGDTDPTDPNDPDLTACQQWHKAKL